MIQIDKHIRNKLYWIDYSDLQKSYVDGKFKEHNLNVIDLGFDFASLVKDREEAQIRIMASEYLSEVLEAKTNNDKSSGLIYVLLKNIGIILENFLDLYAEKFLLDYSKNIGVIILWEGKVINNSQFLWPDSGEYSLEFNDTNVQKINL